MLSDILPEYASISETLKVIDVAKTTGGLLLRILMNASIDEALGILSEASLDIQPALTPVEIGDRKKENHWAWRLRMAELIASQLDPDRFGLKGFYVFGSTKNATAGPKSDIDILIHFQGTKKQQKDLENWLEGWSLCLAEMNRLRTGYKTDGILDLHFVTDADISKKTSYAMKIGAVTDAAWPLPMMSKEKNR
jgi:pyruvate,water dikinase